MGFLGFGGPSMNRVSVVLLKFRESELALATNYLSIEMSWVL